jgi:hypothetical protein
VSAEPDQLSAERRSRIAVGLAGELETTHECQVYGAAGSSPIEMVPWVMRMNRSLTPVTLRRQGCPGADDRSLDASS